MNQNEIECKLDAGYFIKDQHQVYNTSAEITIQQNPKCQTVALTV